MMQHTTEIRVRYAETDQMRRAYHANYLVWFEAARLNMLRQYDMPYDKFEAEGYYLPVVEAHVHYKSPANFDEKLKVHTRINEKPRARIRIEYEIENNTGVCIATGYTLHSFMNASGRPTKPPELFLKTIKIFF